MDAMGMRHPYQETKIIKYCACPAGRVTCNFHSSCKHMHLSFKSVCNKEHKGVICNLALLSNSSQSTRPFSIIFSKVFKTLLKLFLIFFNVV